MRLVVGDNSTRFKHNLTTKVMLVRDILLVSIHGNPASEGIAVSTKSPLNISHSAIEVKSTGDVIEAEFGPGVICSDNLLWNYKNRNRKKYYSDWYESKVDPYTMVGQKYFRGFFINFLLYRVFNWLMLPKVANYIINREKINQVICSTINAKCRGLINPWKALPTNFEIYIKK